MVKNTEGKYKSVKSVLGQYIRGQIKAEDVFSKSKRSISSDVSISDVDNNGIRNRFTKTTHSERTTNSYRTCNEREEFEKCNNFDSIGSTEKDMVCVSSKEKNFNCDTEKPINSITVKQNSYEKRVTKQEISHPNVEMRAQNLFCLSSYDKKNSKKTNAITANSTFEKSINDKRCELMSELQELQKISSLNDNQISKLLQKLNSIKLSINLRKEEQQRLEHSRQIRFVNMELLLNMLRSRLENEHKTKTITEKFKNETEIIGKLFILFDRMEEVKMKLEYENTHNLYTIKELKEENVRLEKIKMEISKEINHVTKKT
ncbi:hypothetical protein PGB90_003190 [Kerria lacca]